MTSQVKDKALHPNPAWAAQIGHSTLELVTATALEGDVMDRLLIIERVGRYGWCFDERNFELMRDCFTADGVWEGSVMGETNIGPFAGREEVAKWMSGFWPQQFDQRRHMFTNVIIDDLTQSSATVHAYLLLAKTADRKLDMVTTGPYRFLMEKELGVWRISRLSAGFDAPF
jgi:hypothetical protein